MQKYSQFGFGKQRWWLLRGWKQDSWCWGRFITVSFAVNQSVHPMVGMDSVCFPLSRTELHLKGRHSQPQLWAVHLLDLRWFLWSQLKRTCLQDWRGRWKMLEVIIVGFSHGVIATVFSVSWGDNQLGGAGYWSVIVSCRACKDPRIFRESLSDNEGADLLRFSCRSRFFL